MSRFGSFAVDTAGDQQRLFDRGLAARILTYTTDMRGWVALALVSAPLLSAVQLARPYIMKLAVDDAILPGDAGLLLRYTALFLAVLLGELAGMYGQLMLLTWMGQRVLVRLREALFRKVLRLDHGYFGSHATGTTLTRLTNDLESIQELFAAGIVTLVTDILKLVGIMGVMLWLNWRLALITFAVLPVLYVISNWFRSRLRLAYRHVRNAVAAVNAQLATTVDGIEDVQALSLEADLEARFAGANDRHRRANLDSIMNDSLLYATVEMLASWVIAGLIWFGGGEAVRGAVTLGVLVAFIEYVQMFFVPIRDLSSKYAVLQSAFASAEKVFGLLDRPIAVEEPPAAVAPTPGGELRFAGVTFGYDPERPVLRDIDFAVPPRGFVAVVGPTGHGKSTILRLLRRYWDVDAGCVELDGADVRTWPLGELRRRTLAVDQRSTLFAGTVRENLLLGETIADDVLLDALRRSGFDRLPDPTAFLDRAVQEGGRNLSQGERQLLALARVLCRDPEVLVLDEATAHIDSATEGTIYQALRGERGRRTLLAIAHRLSTIREADQILVVRHGRIEERGTHDELIAAGGTYANLIRLHDLDAAEESP
jgi:ATP-binding cassette subfamily B protein